MNDTDVCEGTFLINLKNSNLGDVENTFGTNFYQFMVKNILGLNAVPKPDDAADALAVALCHSQTNSIMSDNSM